jgi:hypothetical protein
VPAPIQFRVLMQCRLYIQLMWSRDFSPGGSFVLTQGKSVIIPSHPHRPPMR